ncbi:MAG TPA: DUF2171 domain-containing protein [Sphingomicrobium sp.]|nr:DUF2171 domain-containing protein [Sphingomicrobium sp.]
MAYDRYETTRGRWSDFDRDSDRGRRDERGFFERAGDEIASWFGDEEAERRRREDERITRTHGWNRDFDRDEGRFAYRGSWQDRDRRNWDDDRWSDRGYRTSFAGNRGYERDFGPRSYSYGGYGYGPRAERSFTPANFGGRGTVGESSFGYGAGAGYGSGGFGFERETPHDRHYEAWRRRQLDELDRDYDEFRRENQQRFEKEFGTWREKRMQKRSMLGQIREHMDVVGSDGESVGKVDCVKGDRIILTRSDSDDNRHHAIHCAMVDSIEGDQIRLEVPAEEAKTRWEEFGRDHSAFGRDRDEEGEVNLERAFSGTYR